MEQQKQRLRKSRRKKKNFFLTRTHGIVPPATNTGNENRNTKRKTKNQQMNHREKEDRIWAEIVEDLRTRVAKEGVEKFILPLKLCQDTGTKLIIEHPADIFVAWLETYYIPEIKLSAAKVLDGAREIECVVATEVAAPVEIPEQVVQAPLPAPMGHLPIAESSIKGKSKKKRKTLHNTGLNADYTFDNFVVGSNSEFAVAAAKAVVNSPCKLYSPFFIHGASGIGKTHLLCAIGNAIASSNENLQVLYVTSEDFTNTYIDAIARKGDALSNFRKKYREADVLLIDDVQFLSQKDKTQEEFFHTFNALLNSGKQIVLASDCPATEISRMDYRLTSRFEQGLTVELQAPDLETRIAILRNKRRAWKSELIGDDVLEYLAKNITRSVRRLEGALMRLATFASFSQKSPSIIDARLQLKDLFQGDKNTSDISISDIQKRVAEEFNIKVADLNGRRRTANVAHPRQVAMYLARKHTQCSLQDIGAAFGGRDHGTVIHAAKTIEEKLISDSQLNEIVNRLAHSFA